MEITTLRNLVKVLKENFSEEELKSFIDCDTFTILSSFEQAYRCKNLLAKFGNEDWQKDLVKRGVNLSNEILKAREEADK